VTICGEPSEVLK